MVMRWQLRSEGAAAHTAGSATGVEETGPLKTCCGAATFFAHWSCACVVQVDTHLAVAQSLLHEVVHCAMQFFIASLSAPAVPAARRHNANVTPAFLRL